MHPTVCLKFRLIQIAALCLAGAVLTVAAAAGAAAAERKVTVIGSSRIYDDVSNARNAAIAEGLLSAVEIVALDVISHQRLKANFDVLSRQIQENRQAFTLGYQVLKEVNAGDHYRLLIRSTVSTDKIQAMLEEAGIGASAEKLPRILLLVAEKKAAANAFNYWWRPSGAYAGKNVSVQAIRQILDKQGYPLLRPEDLNRSEILGELAPPAGMTRSEALAMGRRAGADVVIFGKARAQTTSNKMGGTNIKTFKATVSIAALDVRQEARIAAVDQTATAAHPKMAKGSRDALAKAGKQAGQALADRIATAWEARAEPADQMKVHIEGSGNILKELVQFRNALRQTEGVSGLRTLSRSSGEAELAVSYAGSARQLADQIILHAFDDFGVDIYEREEGLIRVRLLTDDGGSISETDLGPN
jgi:hypothetical protein